MIRDGEHSFTWTYSAIAAHLAGQSRLSGWRVTHGPRWLAIEGVVTQEEEL